MKKEIILFGVLMLFGVSLIGIEWIKRNRLIDAFPFKSNLPKTVIVCDTPDKNCGVQMFCTKDFTYCEDIEGEHVDPEFPGINL